MPDIYLNPEAITIEALEEIKHSLERRAATPQQSAALTSYLSDVDFPDGARVLDIGCGTGPQARRLAGWPRVREVVGVDQLEPLLERARELASEIPNLLFQQADARDVPFKDGSFDVVVLHTLLTHVAAPEEVLSEVHRVLRPGGFVAIYDGDFSTMSVATSDADPLQACISAFVEGNVHDKWLVRRLPQVLIEAGFVPQAACSHAHLETVTPALTKGWTERGTLYMYQWGRIDKAMRDALVAECHRRIEVGAFYGFMNYVSLIAKRA